MLSVCVLSAAWQRFDVSRMVFSQRQWVCQELAARGIQAQALVVADDDNLDIADEFGFLTVEAPNRPLGEKCNVGLRAAAATGADFVVWIGSDDWIHPDVFLPLSDIDLAGTPTISTGSRLAIVDLTTSRMQRLSAPSKYGAIPWIIDSRLLKTTRTQLIQPGLSRGLDGGLIRGIRLARISWEWLYDDPHDFRCVDFKTKQNVTPYGPLAANIGVGDEESPWPALAEFFPQQFVDQARALAA